MRTLVVGFMITLPFFCEASPLVCTDPLVLLAENQKPAKDEALDAFNELFKPLHKREMEQIKGRLEKGGNLKDAVGGRMQATTVLQAIVKLQNAAGKNWQNLRRLAIETLGSLIESRTEKQAVRAKVKKTRKIVSEPVRPFPNRELEESVNGRVIALSGDGRYLATENGYNSWVYIRDLKSGAIIRKIEAARFPGHIHGMVFSDDGNYLAIVGNDVHIYKGPKFKMFAKIEREDQNLYFTNGEFSKDNKRFLIRATPYSLEISLSNRPKPRKADSLGGEAWYGPRGSPLYQSVDPDRTDDNDLRVFKAGKAEEVTTYLGVLNSSQRSRDVTRDGLWLTIGGTRNGDFIVWKSGSESPYYKKDFGSHIEVVRFSPDGKLIAIGHDADKEGHIFDVAHKKFIDRIPSKYISAITFSSDGSTMFVVGTKDIIIDMKKWMEDK